MRMKIDLSKDGLALFYKPYEIIGWDVVWNSPEAIASGAVWEKVNFGLGPNKTISRASVIFFLNRQVDLGFMGWKDATGKGGHHRLYFPQVNMELLVQKIQKAWVGKYMVLKDQARNYDKGGDH